MKKTIQLTFISLIIFCVFLLASSCSYIKMMYHNEKEEVLEKISPFIRHDKPAAEDNNNINIKIPLYTSDFKDLDNQIFSSENGKLGLYFPDKFMKKVKYHFYLLDEDFEGKIPVIFVHGVNGTPADWKYIVQKIDKSHFSHIVFYYPTGIRLNDSAELLYKGLKEIHEHHGRIILIAHSMGGLVSRGAIRHFALDKLEDYIPLYISLSTPYGGHKQAQNAIDHLPNAAVVPSWRDVASKSEYIQVLYDPALPAAIDFHLIFGYKNPRKIRIGPNSDGSITIKSQLDPRAQREAFRLYGFDEDHVTILESSEVMSILNEILQKSHQRIKSEAS